MLYAIAICLVEVEKISVAKWLNRKKAAINSAVRYKPRKGKRWPTPSQDNVLVSFIKLIY